MTVSTETFGVHLMLDGYGADAEKLRDRTGLFDLLGGLPAKLGMHPIAPPQVLEVGPKNRKDPGGVSGFIMIAESHFSFHTFPARRFVTLDVYTCQAALDCDWVAAFLQEYFCWESFDLFVQRRGQRYPSHDFPVVDKEIASSTDALTNPQIFQNSHSAKRGSRP